MHPARPQSLDNRWQKQLISISQNCQPQSTLPDSVAGSVASQRRKSGITILFCTLLACLTGSAALFLIARSFGLSRGFLGADKTDNARRVPSHDSIQLKIQELCESDIPIRSALDKRKATFADFSLGAPRQNQLLKARLLSDKKTDPLGALIGFSYKQSRQVSNNVSLLSPYSSCPELRRELFGMWHANEFPSSTINSQLINVPVGHQDNDSLGARNVPSPSVGNSPNQRITTPFVDVNVPSTTTIPSLPVTEHR